MGPELLIIAAIIALTVLLWFLTVGAKPIVYRNRDVAFFRRYAKSFAVGRGPGSYITVAWEHRRILRVRKGSRVMPRTFEFQIEIPLSSWGAETRSTIVDSVTTLATVGGHECIAGSIEPWIAGAEADQSSIGIGLDAAPDELVEVASEVLSCVIGAAGLGPRARFDMTGAGDPVGGAQLIETYEPELRAMARGRGWLARWAARRLERSHDDPIF